MGTSSGAGVRAERLAPPPGCLDEDPEWEDPGPLPFQRRVYSLAELERILDRAGLTLAGVYDSQGAERAPTAEQDEIYVVARR